MTNGGGPNLCDVIYRLSPVKNQLVKPQSRNIKAREGVIIECPLNYLFHDVVTIILASRMGVSEMVVNVGNVVTLIYGIIHRRQTVIFWKNHDF